MIVMDIHQVSQKVSHVDEIEGNSSFSNHFQMLVELLIHVKMVEHVEH